MQSSTESIEPAPHSGTPALITEIERYLEAVAFFRELGHEPSWRAETPASDAVVRVRRWLEPVSRA